jgi:hypothetical protein
MINYGARGDWFSLMWALDAGILATVLWATLGELSNAQTQLEDTTEQSGG